MHNLVRLVQGNGKAIVLPGPDIVIVRTLEPGFKKKFPEARSGVWLRLNGQMQHVVARESMGFLLNKAGGSSVERILLNGPEGTRISMPREAFATAVEGVRTKNAVGEAIPEEDVTVVNTNLSGVSFHVSDSAEHIYDLLATDASEDDGSYDENGDPITRAAAESAKPAKPARHKTPKPKA